MKKFSLAWLMMGVFVAASVCGLVVFNQNVKVLNDRNADLQKQISAKEHDINQRDLRLVAAGKGAALIASLATRPEENKDVLNFIRSIKPDSLCFTCALASGFDSTLPDDLEIYFCHEKPGAEIMPKADSVVVPDATKPLVPKKQAIVLYDTKTDSVVDSLLFENSLMHAMSMDPFEITVLRSTEQQTYVVAQTGFQSTTISNLAPPCSYTPASPYDR